MPKRWNAGGSADLVCLLVAAKEINIHICMCVCVCRAIISALSPRCNFADKQIYSYVYMYIHFLLNKISTNRNCSKFVCHRVSAPLPKSMSLGRIQKKNKINKNKKQFYHA